MSGIRPPRAIALSGFLARLIVICMLPMVLLASWLAYDRLHEQQEGQERMVKSLADKAATDVDQLLRARIRGLNMLAVSPLVDDRRRWPDLYREAEGYRSSFDSHVILADATPPRQMLFNTRAPFGSPLPALPRPSGRSSADIARATGKPAVGDRVIGPVAKQPLVTIAVPVHRGGSIPYLLLATFETSSLTDRIKRAELPPGWQMALRDSTGAIIAGSGVPSEGAVSVIARSAESPWTVVVSVPHELWNRPFFSAALVLGGGLLVAILTGLAGGFIAGRRLARSVATLTKPGGTLSEIAEVEAARRVLVAATTDLADSEQRFRLLFEEAPLPICFVDREGNIHSRNRSFDRTFGYGPHELATVEDWWCLAYPDQAYRALMQENWLNNTSQDLSCPSQERECRVTCKDGVVRTVLVSSISLPGGILVTFYDITERQAAEDRLRLWGEGFEKAGFGVAIADARNNCFVAVNPAFARERGYLQEELVGQTIMTVYPSDCRERAIENIRAIDGIGHGMFESEHLCQDGRRFPVLLDITVIQNKEGTPVNRVAYALDISERKRAEEELTAERTFLRTLIDTIPDLIWLKDAAGVYLACNSEFEKFFGAREAEIVNRTDYDFMPLEVADFFREHDRRAMAAGGPSVNEERITYASDGHEAFLETIKTPMKDITGDVIGVLGIGRDISAIKKSELALRESEVRLRTILDNAPDGVFVIDAAGSFTYINGGGLRMLGYEQGEQPRLSILDVVPPQDATLILSHFEILKEAGHLSRELNLQRQDGTLVPVEVNAVALPDGCYYGACRDITSRKQAEETLRKLYMAVEQSPTMIVITDAAGTIEFVNPQFTRITGYAEDEVLGQNPRILRGDTHQEVYDKLWTTLREGNVWEGDFHNRKKDGAYFWEHATISPIRNERGDITHYLAAKEDITERRNLEEQLRQFQKMEAVGQLAGGIAHDFNNIMQVIMGNTQLQVMENKENNLDSHYLEEIFKAVERGASLTRSLLVFSRKQKMEVASFDLNNLIRESKKLIQRLIPEDISFTVDLQDGGLNVNGDAGLVQQIFFNLVTNARDAIGGQGHIHISTAVVEVNDAFLKARSITAPVGSYVRVTVRDDGCGISDDHKGKIFEPFFTTKEVGKGTGLGLPMIHGTVKQMKGFITVDSAVGEGTAFNIYFPEDHGNRAVDEVTDSIPDDLAGKGRLILVVEDEESVSNSLAHILRMFNYQVLQAANEHEALTLATEHSRDLMLVIMDIILPGVNGEKLLSLIHGKCPGLPAIYISGYSPQLLESKNIRIRHLQKPAHPIQLLKQVKLLLENNPPAQNSGENHG